jgi:hypothetical protein
VIKTSDVFDDTQGATLTSGALTVLGPWNLVRRPGTKSFVLANLGTVTLSGARVECNPDFQGVMAFPGMLSTAQGAPLPQQYPNPALWFEWSSNATATFNSLPAGGVRGVSTTDVYRWWRIVALSTAPGTLTVSGWLLSSSMV